MPYLDEQPLTDLINFTVHPAHLQNITIYEHPVSVHLCPSDPYERSELYGGLNYRANLGTIMYRWVENTGAVLLSQ